MSRWPLGAVGLQGWPWAPPGYPAPPPPQQPQELGTAGPCPPTGASHHAFPTSAEEGEGGTGMLAV